MPKCRQVSAAFLPCPSYHAIMRSRCFASLDSSRARTALTARGMFSQKFLIPRITQVYGFYLNELSVWRGQPWRISSRFDNIASDMRGMKVHPQHLQGPRRPACPPGRGHAAIVIAALWAGAAVVACNGGGGPRAVTPTG